MPEQRTILNEASFVDTDGEIVAAIVSIHEATDEGAKYLEYEVHCQNCKAINWIIIGTAPSEYRCINCVEWLTKEDTK